MNAQPWLSFGQQTLNSALGIAYGGGNGYGCYGGGYGLGAGYGMGSGYNMGCGIGGGMGYGMGGGLNNYFIDSQYNYDYGKATIFEVAGIFTNCLLGGISANSTPKEKNTTDTTNYLELINDTNGQILGLIGKTDDASVKKMKELENSLNTLEKKALNQEACEMNIKGQVASNKDYQNWSKSDEVNAGLLRKAASKFINGCQNNNGEEKQTNGEKFIAMYDAADEKLQNQFKTYYDNIKGQMT